MPKHHAITHMTTPSAARTIRLFSFITISPTMMMAIPTASMARACQGFTIFLSVCIRGLLKQHTKFHKTLHKINIHYIIL